MIEYSKGPFSLNLIFKIHGSSLYGSFLPGLISCVIYYIFYTTASTDSSLSLVSATVISLLVTSVSFVIVYRVKFCYDRYWEASRAVHIMMSKWTDATVHACCFHMQSLQLKKMQPPLSLSKHPHLFDPSVYTDRQVLNLDNIRNDDDTHQLFKNDDHDLNSTSSSSSSTASVSMYNDNNWIIKKENMLDGGWGLLNSVNNDNDHDNNKKAYILYSDIVPNNNNNETASDSWAYKKTPSIFLQELAHLSSLCVAVAFNTFRDFDGDNYNSSSSPFGRYELQKPWPVTNPYLLDKNNHNVIMSSKKVLLRYLRYFCGLSRSSDSRLQYSTGRPLLVLGGVSDNELFALRRARGPSAKMTLVWFWLSEFITREQLSGSLGEVAPPIVSRIHQFLSDGMKFYNDARKIVYIPFPFVHDQLSTIIVAPLMIFIPLMVVEYTKTFWVGFILSFLVITCINGFLEVARELENPFRNFPNDIPLCTLLAMYNESLISMCSGFHPDHYWNTNKPKKIIPDIKIDKSRMNHIDDIISSL